MQKIFLIFLSSIVIGIIYLTIKGSEVQEIKTEIEISASPSEVWDIITDINKWQKWSPIINFSQGEALVGSKLNITMVGKNKGQDGPKYNPTIIKLENLKYFHWSADVLSKFIFTNDKIFKLEKTSKGTRLIHIETFQGLLTAVFSSKMEKEVPLMLNSMNQALKELAEGK